MQRLAKVAVCLNSLLWLWGQGYAATAQTTLSIQTDPFGFSGEYQDAESHLQYLDARYYNPELSRFVEWDSYDLLNRYAYADGNPVMNEDPSGHMAFNLNSLIPGDGFTKDKNTLGYIASGVSTLATLMLLGEGIGALAGYLNRGGEEMVYEEAKLSLGEDNSAAKKVNERVSSRQSESKNNRRDEIDESVTRTTREINRNLNDRAVKNGENVEGIKNIFPELVPEPTPTRFISGKHVKEFGKGWMSLHERAMTRDELDVIGRLRFYLAGQTWAISQADLNFLVDEDLTSYNMKVIQIDEQGNLGIERINSSIKIINTYYQ